MTVETIAPVFKSVTVAVDAARAFDVFTQRMGRWWKPDHSIAEAPMVDLCIEPYEGGRWFEVDAEGHECPWGRVMVWEPPSRVVLAWQINGQWQYDPGFETELEIRFVAEGPSSTRVELEHRNLDRFGDGASGMRERFDAPGGWLGLLERYAGFAADGGGSPE